MNASFEEKSVWIKLLSLVVVLGGYFVIAGTMLWRGITILPAYVGLFAGATVVLVIVLVVAHIAAALLSRPEARDERDRLIEWRSESNASWILGAGTFIAIAGLVLAVDNVWVAHILMLSMLVSEVAKCVFQLTYYRHGM